MNRSWRMPPRILTAAVLAILPSSSYAGSIVGTIHDLSGHGWDPGYQVCIFCHTPHNAQSRLVPLWNHATTTQTFTIYSSGSLDATPGQPAGVSKACLSCHDGTVAVDSYGGSTTGSFFVQGQFRVGTDLSNDHPISFPYDAALATADGGLIPPAGDSAGAENLPLYGGRMECATCHDVHDYANYDFLRMSNTGSALCLNCHVK